MIKLKVEKVDLYSNILEKEMSMLVYLPTTYNLSLIHISEPTRPY